MQRRAALAAARRRLGLLASALGVLVSACGVDVTKDDPRPATLEFITTSILAPSCGSAPCHSTFAQQGRRGKPGDPVIPLVFDTVIGARVSFQRDGQLIDHTEDGDQVPTLIVNLTEEYSNAPRMPYDAPLPNADIALIAEFIKAGGPGVCTGASACHGTEHFACKDDRSFNFAMKLSGACP